MVIIVHLAFLIGGIGVHLSNAAFIFGGYIMSEYTLKIKQLVDYPRCRIYRQFVQSLIEDPHLRVGTHAGLFHYTVLCSYANFRTSYKRIEGFSFTICPGEWLCRVSELAQWFRLRFQHQALSILKDLQVRHLITYTLLCRGKLVKFSITDWCRHNCVLDYNAPCQKETGFFFLPVSTAKELISYGRCSEMDALLDLWINTVYDDKQVQGSESGPVVYLRNGTGCPLVSFAQLGKRWGISKSTAARYLCKLQALGLIELLSFPGTHGSAIYLSRYLSTMFEVSDVPIDKDEVALALNIKLDLPQSAPDPTLLSPKISVSPELSCVSNSDIAIIMQKVENLLDALGFFCPSCPNIRYKLLPLSSECRDGFTLPYCVTDSNAYFLLTLSCGACNDIFRFELHLQKEASHEESR